MYRAIAEGDHAGPRISFLQPPSMHESRREIVSSSEGVSSRGITSKREVFCSGQLSLSTLMPLVIGLSSARVGIIVSLYASYAATDASVISEGSSLFASLVLGAFLVVVATRKASLQKRRVVMFARLCIAFEALSLVGLEFFQPSGAYAAAYPFVCATNAVSGPCAMFYWLRRARQSTASFAIAFVFSAILLSELEIYLCSLFPAPVQHTLAAGIVLLQYPAMMRARKAIQPFALERLATDDSFSFMKGSLKNRSFLIASAFGVASLGIVIGLLRGYPNGAPIAFGDGGRLCYMVLTIAACVVIISQGLRNPQKNLLSNLWIMLFICAACSVTSFAAWPTTLEIGAVFVTTFNALMIGVHSYLTIAFMTHGSKDPYYYAIAGWLAFFFPRAVARMVVVFVLPFGENMLLSLVVLSDAILASALIVFVRFFTIARLPAEDVPSHRDSVIQKIMGLADANPGESLDVLQEASVRKGVAALGKRSMLSDREQEVLVLYVLGNTQKKVAERLFITSGTVHEHIKHVYTKTGLHSRQEILDFIRDPSQYDHTG